MDLRKLRTLMDNDFHEVYEPGSFICDEATLQAYSDTIQTLLVLRFLGQCDFSADNPDDKYDEHQINIKWTHNEYGGLLLDVRLVEKVLSGMKEILIDEDGNWILTTRIYNKYSS